VVGAGLLIAVGRNGLTFIFIKLPIEFIYIFC